MEPHTGIAEKIFVVPCSCTHVHFSNFSALSPVFCRYSYIAALCTGLDYRLATYFLNNVFL